MASPILSVSQCRTLFAAMQPDEVGMFLRLLFGADPFSFPITPDSLNRRLRRITRQAKTPRRVTVRTLQAVGRQLSQVELAALVPADSGAARPSLRAFRGLRGQVGAT